MLELFVDDLVIAEIDKLRSVALNMVEVPLAFLKVLLVTDQISRYWLRIIQPYLFQCNPNPSLFESEL
jgi:hypothetical protein